MADTCNCADQITEKDEIIKRQALELACLASRIENQNEVVEGVVMERTAEFVVESQQMIEDKRHLQDIVSKTLKTLKVLCRDDGERLKFLLATEIVDEEWYRSEYPDVAQNYPKGALHHFCKFGIFEGRKPNGWM